VYKCLDSVACQKSSNSFQVTGKHSRRNHLWRLRRCLNVVQCKVTSANRSRCRFISADNRNTLFCQSFNNTRNYYFTTDSNNNVFCVDLLRESELIGATKPKDYAASLCVLHVFTNWMVVLRGHKG